MRINISTQPDDETCGPTSLQAVYQYYQDDISLEKVVKQVYRLRNGGTTEAYLARHALKRGYHATIYVYNIDIFDPAWFYPRPLSNAELIAKLQAQLHYKKSQRFKEATVAYIDCLRLGATVKFQDLTTRLLRTYFDQKKPILTGLSATYLYRSRRERERSTGEMIYDDIQGTPCGHFVVLCGWDEVRRRIVVADPHRANPLSHDNYYKVRSSRLINAIMLGALTNDANLLILEPKK